MVQLLILSGVLTVLIILTKFMPVVSELPFGMDYALTLFVGTLNGIIDLMPWMGTVWNFVLLALFIKGLLFMWHWIVFFINLFAGGSGAPKN